MTQRDPNVIDRIAGLVPGYRGYAERETRRAQDKRLREHVAALLDASKSRLDAVGRDLTDAGDVEPLDDLDRLRRVIGTCADALRHAEAGGSGLMDDQVVRIEDLDRVHAHDLDLASQAGALVAAVDQLDASRLPDLPALRAQAEDLRRAIAGRHAVLHPPA